MTTTKTTKRKDPAKPDYSRKDKPAVRAEVLARLSKGEPLRQICMDEGMPSREIVWRWIHKFPEFKAAYEQARDHGHDEIAESLLEIADDGRNDWMEKKNRDGEVVGYIPDREVVARSKLRVWTRLQLLAKWSPQRYGDRQSIDLKAKVDVGDMSDEAIRQELAALGVIVPSGVVAPPPPKMPLDDVDDEPEGYPGASDETDEDEEPEDFDGSDLV